VVTQTEKNLYNTYLRISRSSRNKPFSYRKDFSDLDDSTALHLKRIYNLLSKYPHIKADDYFAAPFKVYPNADFFPLDFFAGMGGVNAYTVYMKQVQEMSPDSNEQIEFIQRSLKYIGMFCIKNGITLKQYPKHKTGVTYSWMKHVKKHEISIYSLMDFPEISNIISNTPEDERELFLGEMSRYFWGYKTKYIQSKLAKEFVEQGLKKVEKVIKSKNSE
jgi:hypothetical protein